MTSPKIHREGAGPTVVLVHGVGLDRSMWEDLSALLAANYRVVTYDLLGHGDAPDEPGERSLDDFVQQLSAVIDEVADPTVDLVGLSLGALIALHAAAADRHRIRSVMLANMVYGRNEAQQDGVNERLELAERIGMSTIADLAVDRWFTPQWRTENAARCARVHTRIATTNLEAYLKAYRVFASTDASLTGTARHVTMPAMAITGEHDSGSTPAMTARLADDLPAGTAQILEGLHHLPVIEAPARFAAALRSFHGSLATPSAFT